MVELAALNGVFAVRKPAGPSSAQLVEQVKTALLRRFAGKRDFKQASRKLKVGHGGTLDPMASGVLVVGVNAGCRRLGEFLAGSKTYVAEALFGTHYDTLDTTGTLLRTDGTLTAIDSDKLDAACRKWTGKVMQRPPAFSAIRINGKRAYELAREASSKRPREENDDKGEEEMEMRERPVTVYSITVLSIEFPRVRFEMDVSGGTYVRSLIRDIAAEMGTVAAMAALERTKQGSFVMADAIDLEQVPDRIQLLLNKVSETAKEVNETTKGSLFGEDKQGEREEHES